MYSLLFLISRSKVVNNTEEMFILKELIVYRRTHKLCGKKMSNKC